MGADLRGEAPSSRIELGQVSDFNLGQLRISPARREVVHNGERRLLEPRVMQVLVALAEARPGVVSREQLAERCWDGRIVGDAALNRCILALRHLAKEFIPEPYAIETIARVGYSMVESGTENRAPAASKLRPSRRQWISLIIAIVVLGAVALAGWSVFGSDRRSPVSIAVLPFRNLGTGNAYFAEGVSEEILSRLAQEPQFRVAGQTSSSQFNQAADLREVGRRLNVDYVLEGTVRSQEGRVKVDAGLVDTKTGARLWSDSYDGRLDDIFAIQQQVGTSVAAALQQRLVRTPAVTGPLVTNGQVYSLYLTARGMLKTRNPQLAGPAVDLLRQALRADPHYAPAWASIAEAIRLEASLEGPERVIARLPEAIADARRALALAPDLPQAHGILGTLLGYRTPEAQWHLRRAAELNPRSSEAQLWLASARRIGGDFDGELAAYRRAHELDPLWFRPTRDIAVATAEMGDRASAETIARREFSADFVSENMLMARVAWIFGDISEAARRWSAVTKVESIWQPPARVGLANALRTLGIATTVPSKEYAPVAELRSNTGRVWMVAAPSAAVWKQQNRTQEAALVYHEHNFVAAKLMMNAGRSSELLATYDGPVGLLGIRKGEPLQPYQFSKVALVASALRDGGRSAEASRLLGEADRLISAVYRRGHVPFAFDADAAAIYAAAGRRADALASLERAVKRGWPHLAPDDLQKLSDEPVYAPLHGEPRFAAIVAKLDALYARERQETEKLGLKLAVTG